MLASARLPRTGVVCLLALTFWHVDVEAVRFEESGAARLSSAPAPSVRGPARANALASLAESFHGMPVLPGAFVAGMSLDNPDGGSLTSHSAYRTTIFLLLLATVMLGWLARPKATAVLCSDTFTSFRRRFILVWVLAVSADWLQGPYIYSIYDSYGYAPHDIALLFAVDFFSSMIFSTFVGAIVDSWGRKRGALLYCVLCGASCLTKHTSTYWILLAGRIVGAAATALLFCTFECWMVAEHRAWEFDESLLHYMFGSMYFAQYLAAIVAGLLAQASVQVCPLVNVVGTETLYYGGVTIPYDIAFALVAVNFILIVLLWEERRGCAGDSTCTQFVQSLAQAVSAIRSSSRVFSLGILVAFFEGSMMCFVFNWTPAMTSAWADVPHGLVFSAFMMACMCGSSVFALASPAPQPARQLLAAVALGALGFGVAAVGVWATSFFAIFAGFVLFEFCVGFYFPAAGLLKSLIVPEHARAGIYSLFRVPLNAVAVGMVMTQWSLSVYFGVCCALVTAAAAVLLPLALERVPPEAHIDQAYARAG